MKTKSVALLITSHNRRETTLKCLAALHRQELRQDTILSIFMVDDGSTDGTSEAVRRLYPALRILQGEGDLYWNGGMRLAFFEAMKSGYDYYFWLNDDTLLFPDTVQRMLSTAESIAASSSRASIIVGSTRDSLNDVQTYGGVFRPSRFRRLKFKLVPPGDQPVECETVNGNCVLVPSIIADRIGNLDRAFSHAMGDFDYGLRARKSGFSCWVASGYVGICDSNSPEGSFEESRLPLRERLDKMFSPKGLPINEWMLFARRYGGAFWILFGIFPYVKLLFSAARLRWKVD